jgi:hypothetical protein
MVDFLRGIFEIWTSTLSPSSGSNDEKKPCLGLFYD